MSPSHNEDEYFAREDAEKKRRMALDAVKATAAAEREQLRQLHFMHCPRCGMQLQELRYKGVSAERCFGCHGIFLDEGELEKLVGHKDEGYWQHMMNFFSQKDFSRE